MQEKVRRLFQKPLVLFALAAVCLALPFHVSEFFFLTFVGAALLFCGAKRVDLSTGLRGFFALGFGFGFIYHLCIYHWLVALHPLSAAGLGGIVSLLIVLLAYVGASAIHALFFGAAFVLWGALCRVGRFRLFFFGVSLLLAEVLTSVGTLAFPWARFTLPLAAVAPLVSLASVVGPLGCEALLFAFGALTTRAAFGVRRTVSIVLAVFVLVLQAGFGILYCASPREGVVMKVAAVQTAYTSSEKWNVDRTALLDYLRTSALSAADEGAEVIVFPESVLATRVVRGDANEAFFASLAEECDAGIAAGCIYYEDGKTYNATCLFDSEGLISYNAKRHLVPFGEYLPWQDVLSVVLPAVANMTFYRSSYTVGETSLAGEAIGTTFGGLVCFDTLFSPLAAQSAKDGAHVLLAPTNDAWFKHTVAAREHLWHGTWRAVETGRAFVQSANTGISAVVDYDGTLLSEVPLGQEGVAFAEVELTDVVTPYVQTGDLVFPFCLLVVVACGALALLRRLRGGAKGE
ncbi:MAG: apolipoprotein N-acyltransferase [Clostridia bacterium]|nr:apolipoprotein N-acyltransferase [Clostridia bacterium]